MATPSQIQAASDRIMDVAVKVLHIGDDRKFYESPKCEKLSEQITLILQEFFGESNASNAK